jgi:excisionase family DNA binding protein
MRKSKKQKDKKQIEMNLRVTGLVQQTKSTQHSKANKPAKAKRSNTSLSNKSTKSKIKRKACSRKKLSGTLFDNLITVEELAVIFGLAPQTIRNWVALGKLPYVKIGKRNLFLVGSVQEWLNRKEIPRWQ